MMDQVNDKSLKMYLVSDFDSKGCQWWVIDYSAEEAAAQIKKNWPDSAFKAEQVPFTDEKTWGAHLSLDPHANDDVVYQTTAEVVAEHKEPYIYGAGGGGWMARHDIKGKSYETFIYHSDGDESHTKRDMSETDSHILQIPVYESDPFEIFVHNGHIEIALKKEVGFRTSNGEFSANGASIEIVRESSMLFGVVNYHAVTEKSGYSNHFFVFASIYAFRDGARWKKMDQFEFKKFKRFVEDARHYDDWEKVVELIRKNEVEYEW